MPTIVVDIFEKPEVPLLLEKYGCTVVTQNMVPLGFADFMWLDAIGKRHTLEHKTVDQLVSEMGGRLDGQLRKHMENADHVGLVIDGVVTPKTDGGVQYWGHKANGKVFFKARTSSIGYEALMAYVWSIRNMGVPVYWFGDLDGLCLGVSAFVHNSMKPTHTALQHHVKTKPVVFREDPYIMSLMGLHDAHIGEKTAQKILDHFGTPHKYFTADVDEGIDTVGRAVFLNSMRAIGRTQL
jgi:hypothetical protein